MCISGTTSDASAPITRKRIHPDDVDEGRCHHLEWSEGNILSKIQKYLSGSRDLYNCLRFIIDLYKDTLFFKL